MFTYTLHTPVPQGDMGAVRQICQLITAKILIKEMCNPGWLSKDVNTLGGDKYWRGEILLDEA